ncbi:hypothetical protein ACU4GR_21290 [Methylobacterium oryzae CBMB20]
MQFLFAVDRGEPAGRRPVRSAERRGAARLPADRRAGQRRRRVPVTVCGEIGGRPLDAMALIGLGYRRPVDVAGRHRPGQGDGAQPRRGRRRRAHRRGDGADARRRFPAPDAHGLRARATAYLSKRRRDSCRTFGRGCTATPRRFRSTRRGFRSRDGTRRGTGGASCRVTNTLQATRLRPRDETRARPEPPRADLQKHGR